MTLLQNNNKSRSVHGQFQNLQGHNGLDHYPMPVTQLKSNSQYSFTQWSQGCLAFMLESIFSRHHPQLPSEYSQYPFNISDKFPGILNGFYICLWHPPSTQHMCSSLMLIHPLTPKYEIYPSFTPSSIMLWVLLMAPTSNAMHLPQTMMWQGTTRAYSLKTALLHAPLIFISCIFYLVGRDQWQTLCFSIRPVKVTSTSQGGGITLQMLALPYQMCC